MATTKAAKPRLTESDRATLRVLADPDEYRTATFERIGELTGDRTSVAARKTVLKLKKLGLVDSHNRVIVKEEVYKD